jgi:hypothetical protein
MRERGGDLKEMTSVMGTALQMVMNSDNNERWCRGHGVER